MMLGRVIGHVVSTAKIGALSGFKILMVRPVDAEGRVKGKAVLALDTVQAGPGDTVLLVEEGNSSRQIVGLPKAPIRTTIMAIVDEIHGVTESGA